MPGFPPLKRREVVEILKRAGYRKEREGAKHTVYGKPGSPRITVPRRRGEIPTGTLNSIIRATGLTKKEFYSLLKKGPERQGN